MQNIEIRNLIVEFETEDVEKGSISKKVALNSINLDVNEGEFICILGKNGSGKSTLAKSLNALIKPTSGTVKIYGLDTNDESKVIDIRKLVGMAFQNPDNQIVASIVEEDIAFGLENIGIETDIIRKRIDDAMIALNIYDLKDKLISKLSGGQKQKVAIAGILAMQSKIIVLDEPTSMIDKSGRIELLELVKKLNKEQGITVILISHFVEEIDYADRVLVMNNGNIVYDDIPSNILLKGKELNDLGIELPLIPRLAMDLKSIGLNFKGNETKVEEICQYLK